MYVFFLFFGIIFAIFLRIIFLIRYKWSGPDTFFHLLKLYYERRGVKNWHEKNFMGPEKIAPYYPPLFGFLLSLFPFKDYSKYRFFPLIFDLINISLLILFCNQFLSHEQTIIALFVYSISPLLVYQNYSLSPRLLSNVFFTLNSLSLFFYFSTSNILYFVSSVFFLSLIFLSHKLTLQSSTVFLLILAFVTKNPIPLFILFLAFLVALVISKGFYIKVMKAHLWLLHYFIKKGISKRLKMEIMWVFGSFPFLILIFLNFNYLMNNLFLVIWFTSLFLLSLLWVIGDGYRHMTNAIFPGSISIALLYPFEIREWVFFILLSLLSIFIDIYLFKKIIPKKVVSKDLLKCYKFITAKGSSNDVILTYPRDFAYATPFFTHMKEYYGMGSQLKKDIGKIKWIITNNPKMWLLKRFKKVYSSNGFYIFSRK